MRFKELDWDDTNTAHIARHNVTPQEVEESCFNSPLILKGRNHRYLIYGRADDGRYLFIVTADQGKGIARVITARSMTEAERELYIRKKG